MAIKRYDPTTAGRRGMSVSAFDELQGIQVPEKSLLELKKKSGGRNATGKITVRHIGGGNRQKYRVIDFKRNKDDVPAKVIGIQYDPNRTVNIALLQYEDGEKRYILAPDGLKVDDTVISGADVDIKLGNALPLSSIPVGTFIHNIEMRAGRGGVIARSAGMAAQLMAKESKGAIIKMPSGEMRYVPLNCRATIGDLGNKENEIVSLGKAGRKRHMGVRPTVRGVVMNPCDHPHGGGEGKSPVGMASPVTPWGKPALGFKTRKKKNASNKFIIKRVN